MNGIQGSQKLESVQNASRHIGTEIDGKKIIIWHGRRYVKDPLHYRAAKSGYVAYSIYIVSKLTGIKIMPPMLVHHFDGDKLNDSLGNLILCDNHAYHGLLESRQRAYIGCGNANWRKCTFCGEWDDPDNMYAKGQNRYHRACSVKAADERRQEIRKNGRKYICPHCKKEFVSFSRAVKFSNIGVFKGKRKKDKDKDKALKFNI